MKNEVDIYWLRAQLRKKLPDKFIKSVGVAGCSDDRIYEGVKLVLSLLKDITGVDFEKMR